VDLYKHLGIGFKGADRGVLLLVAPNDRKYRLEVGYGLEPVINDARAGDAGLGESAASTVYPLQFPLQ
jgi:uncharacterized membrane protein YgcG